MRRRGLGRSVLHVCAGGGHLTLLAAVVRGLALGATLERRRQRLAARGVAALEGHGAPEPSSLAVSALLSRCFVQEEAQQSRPAVNFLRLFAAVRGVSGYLLTQ